MNENNTIAKIYSRKDCPWCVRAKELCDQNNQSYTEIIIGEDIAVEEFRTKFPEVRTVPFIVIEDTIIGGFVQLQERFNQAIN